MDTTKTLDDLFAGLSDERRDRLHLIAKHMLLAQEAESLCEEIRAAQTKTHALSSYLPDRVKAASATVTSLAECISFADRDEIYSSYISPEQEIIKISKRARDFFGLSVAEVQSGVKIINLAAPQYRRKLENCCASLTPRSNMFCARLKVKRADGKTVDFGVVSQGVFMHGELIMRVGHGWEIKKSQQGKLLHIAQALTTGTIPEE